MHSPASYAWTSPMVYLKHLNETRRRPDEPSPDSRHSDHPHARRSAYRLWGLGAGVDLPSKSLRLITAAPPGRPPDVAARIIATGLRRRRPAGRGRDRLGRRETIGVAAIAKASPDGYTLGVISLPQAVPSLLAEGPYDTTRDLALSPRSCGRPRSRRAERLLGVLAPGSDCHGEGLAGSADCSLPVGNWRCPILSELLRCCTRA